MRESVPRAAAWQAEEREDTPPIGVVWAVARAARESETAANVVFILTQEKDGRGRKERAKLTLLRPCPAATFQFCSLRLSRVRELPSRV